MTIQSIAMRPLLTLPLLMCLHASSAWAQTPAEVAARRGLLGEAETAARAGDHAHALELGERAGRISMTASLRFFLATEQRTLGRLADALGNAETCAQLADRDTSLRNRGSLMTQCRAMIVELTPRVGRVTLRVAPPAPPGLQIVLAGQPVSDAFWGVPFVATPGHVVIDATAPGHVAMRAEVDLAAGATLEVPVQLAVDPSSSSPPPSTAAPNATGGSSSGSPFASSAPVQRAVVAGPGAAPWVVVSGGLVLAAGGILALAVGRPAMLQALAEACNGQFTCATSDRGHYDGALALSITGPIAIGGGAAMIAGGLAWWAMGRNHPAHPSSSNAGLAPLAGGAMFSFGGAF